MSESLDDRAEQAEDIVEAEPTKVDELVNAVTANGIELFRSPVDAPYARLTVEHDDGSKHQEVWAIRSRQFALWLRRTAYRLQRRTPAKAVLSDAIENLAARAVRRRHVPRAPPRCRSQLQQRGPRDLPGSVRRPMARRPDHPGRLERD
jgi:hypothetical protein